MQTNWITFSKITEGQMVKVAVTEKAAYGWASRKDAERSDHPFRQVVSIERDPRTVILTFDDGLTGRWSPNSKTLVVE